MKTRKPIAILLMSLFLPSAVAMAGGGKEGDVFKSISFDAARKLAAKEKKWVFIDFYTTWCMPCKMLDRSTFTDPWVQKWLKEHTVPLKIDAEREVALAAKYKIQFYPTMTFLNPDGSEFERISGFLPPEEFKKAAQGLEKGMTALDRARQQVKADPDNPMARMELAQLLSMKGKYEEAFKTYIWSLDHDAEKEPELEGMRTSYLVSAILDLGTSYPPAREEVIRRRDLAEKRILKGKGNPADIGLYISANAGLDDAQRSLNTYDRLAAKEETSEAARSFIPFLFDSLLEAGRYATIAQSMDIMSRVDQELQMATMELPLTMTDLPAEEIAEIKQMQRQFTVRTLANYYQVLLGLGRTEDARRVAQKVLAFDDSAETYNSLAWSAYLSGKPTRENLKQAQRAWELSGKNSVAVLDTLVRVMHLLGQTDKAIEMCEKELAGNIPDRDAAMLRMCLADLRNAKTKTQ